MTMPLITIDGPQVLRTLDGPPTDSYGNPCKVTGVTLLENNLLYVVYSGCKKLEVFECENQLKKLKAIEVNGMENPCDMVGCASQLFISQWNSSVILRVDLHTETSHVFVTRRRCAFQSRLSLVANRLLVTSSYFLLMYDIRSGEKVNRIPLTEDMRRNGVYHAIESNRSSFFVSHGQSDGNATVSEINSHSAGQVPWHGHHGHFGRRDHKCGKHLGMWGRGGGFNQPNSPWAWPNPHGRWNPPMYHNNGVQVDCGHLALNSDGKLFVADWKNNSVSLLDDRLQNKSILLDRKRLGEARPTRLSYDKKNNILAVGLDNGQVELLKCYVN